MDTQVMTAERKQQPVDAKKVEPTVLGVAGAALLALAGFFLWQELALASTVLAVAGAACAAGIAYLAHKKEQGAVGPIALALASLVCGAWYAATKEPVVLIGLGISFVASLVLTLVGQRVFAGPEARLHRAFSWLTTAVSGLIASFAGYFFIFDATESALNGFEPRRAILTLTWLVSGVALVIAGRARKATEMRDAGFVVLAASMAKLMLYDLGHTQGTLRIAALAIGGVVLLGASRVTHVLAKGSA